MKSNRAMGGKRHVKVVRVVSVLGLGSQMNYG